MDAPAAFGPYSILRAISATRDSVSFAARFEGRKDTEHVLALKVLRTELTDDEAFHEALVEDLRLAVRLNHVNVAQTFDFARHDGHSYAAVEFVDGIPLLSLSQAVTAGQKAVTTEVATFICAEACAGLAYAHGRRDERGKVLDIVHTRVSPRTVLLSKSGLVKVVDFGLSRALTVHRPDQNTERDLQFLAPEVVRGDEFDRRADVFSVAALGYLLFAGRTIYAGASGEDLETKAKRGYVPAIQDIDDTVPGPIAELIDRALSPNPDDRFSDATELRTGLAAWLRRNSPGFGRHRLKNYLHRLLPETTYGLLPDHDWEALHRKNFVAYDPDSLIATSVESEPDVPTEKCDLAELMLNPELPEVRKLDLSRMKTGAHPSVRDRALTAGRGLAPVVKRPASSSRSRVVRTPPPMPAVTAPAEEVFASRSYGEDEDGSVTEQPSVIVDGSDENATSGESREAKPLPDLDRSKSGSAKKSASKKGASKKSKRKKKPAPDANARRDGAADEATGSDDEDDSPHVDIPTDVEERKEIEIDPTMVYDDSIDDDFQRMAVAEADALTRPPRSTSTYVGIVLAVLLLGGLAYVGKLFIDQQTVDAPGAVTPSAIFVTSRPQGAAILLDGVETGLTTPSPLRDVPDGTHTVTVTLQGFDSPADQSLGSLDRPPQLAFELEPVAHRVRVDSDPAGASVIYDGDTVGSTPMVLGPLRIDYRQGLDLVLQLEGYMDEHVSVDWAPGEGESSVRRPLHPDPDYVPPEQAANP